MSFNHLAAIGYGSGRIIFFLCFSSDIESDVETTESCYGVSDFAAALLRLQRLPLSDSQNADALPS